MLFEYSTSIEERMNKISNECEKEDDKRASSFFVVENVRVYNYVLSVL